MIRGAQEITLSYTMSVFNGGAQETILIYTISIGMYRKLV